MENGLSALSGNSDNIRSGAYQVFVSLTLSAETELNNSLSAAGFDAVKLTPENYEEVLGELLNKLSDYSYEQAGLAESDVYNGIASLKSQLDSYRDFYIGLIDYTQGVDTASAGASELKNGMAELSDGASGLADGASELYIGCTELKNGTAELVSGTGELQSGASELYNGALGLQEGVNGIYDGASEINEGVSELADGSTELESGSMKVADGAGELSNGASALYDGAAKLKNGTAELRDGTSELYSGSAELYNGCTELCGGTAELYDGCAELCDGTAELFDGCTDLKNGTAEMRSETDGMDEEISDKIDEMIGNITGTDGETVSFVSEKSTNVDAVQFVIQTERIEIEETVTADHEAEEQLTFWQKILRLFGLY